VFMLQSQLTRVSLPKELQNDNFFLDRAKMTNIQRSDGIRRAVISRGVRGLSDCLDLKFSMRSVPSSSI
jgi:hypothetical protein